MPKKRRQENKGLPEGCRWKNGAIRYRSGGKEVTLGKTIAEAYRALSTITEARKDRKTIAHLLDRYIIEVLPTKAAATIKGQAVQAEILRKIMGDNPLDAIEPQHIYQYFDAHRSKVSAKREIALLSHAYTKAVQWGYLSKHPFKGEVRLKGEKPRDRYVEDWEIIECLALPSPQAKGGVKAIQAYIRLKLLTGLRRQDLLKLKVSDCHEDGIHITTSKTGKPIIYGWSDSLKEAVKIAKLIRPTRFSQYIFCSKSGECYIGKDSSVSGWNSIWQRFMARVLAETKVTERFTEHDLRAKVASDAGSLERAQELLTHADSRLTQRVYRRKVEVINPVK